MSHLSERQLVTGYLRCSFGKCRIEIEISLLTKSGPQKGEPDNSARKRGLVGPYVKTTRAV